MVAGDKIPVSLLSGFLGSGKTTLLEHILREQHGLRIALIVNDMAELNVDAMLVANHKVSQKEEKMVRMQNGCVCCTLRGDLLEEIAELAETGSFDYILIEATGISEPQGVAETWTTEFAEMLAADEDARAEAAEKLSPKMLTLLESGGLAKITRLDTLVTVIDSANFYDLLESAQMVSEKYGKSDIDEDDERNISELLIEQIEFANVVLINKADLVPAAKLERIKELVKKLNPAAQVHATVRCQVDPRILINTSSFDFDKAATSAGWLQSLKEVKTPETIEYGVTSFVYRRRRPFHPRRLYELITDCFVLIEDSYDPTYQALDDAEAAKAKGMDVDGNDTPPEEGSDDDDDESMEGSDVYEDEKPDVEGKLKRKRASPLWKNLFRMKGFVWLCTRCDWFGELSCAGAMLTLSHGAAWFATMPEESWPFENPEAIADIRADFEGEWGDRRNELVLIGERLDQKMLQEALDGALVTDDEFKVVQGIMRDESLDIYAKEAALQNIFDDGFEAWLPPKSLVKEALEKGMHAHHGHVHV